MSTTTKPPAKADQPLAREFPEYTFEPYTWVPVDIPARRTSAEHDLHEMVNHVKDVASGAALVFELIADHGCNIDSDNKSYLSPYYLALLQRMAVRSLQVLDEKASDIARRLNESGGEA